MFYVWQFLAATYTGSAVAYLLAIVEAENNDIIDDNGEN